MIKSFIDIKTYRNYLEDFYVYPCDKNNKEQRKKYVDKYSDEELSKIIENTKLFIIYLFEKLENENYVNKDNTFTSIKISDKQIYIFTNCTGGSSPDVLYNPLDFGEDFYVSYYLLNKFLEGFIIYENFETFEEYDEDDSIGYFVDETELVFSTKKSNFRKIKKAIGD